jgi:hypothetical protein
MAPGSMPHCCHVPSPAPAGLLRGQRLKENYFRSAPCSSQQSGSGRCCAPFRMAEQAGSQGKAVWLLGV